MKKLLKNKKGVTLMEVIIGGVLFALVALTVATVLAPMMMSFSIANDIAEYNLFLDDIGNRITSDISQSSSITFTGGILSLTINSEAVSYSISNGILLRNGSKVFSEDFYRGKRIGFNVDYTNLNNIQVEISVISSGGLGGSAANISRTYAVNPIMM